MFKVSSPGLLSSISGISENEDEDEEDENLDMPITPWKELPVLQQFNSWLISPNGKGKKRPVMQDNMCSRWKSYCKKVANVPSI